MVNNAFFNDYAGRAHKHIGSFASKYLACFAFDGDTARLLSQGAPEKEEMDCVFNYLKTNDLIRDCAINVGANYGMHSLRFAEHYERVFSFEPHPAVFKILDFNIEYNNPQKNISIFNYGISDEEQTLTLYDHKGRNIGGSTFEAQNVTDKEGAYKFECQIKPIDQEKSVTEQKIGLFKIDTEGHELHVLKGAKRFIEEQKPVILMEDWSSRNGQESDAIKFLRELGYTNFLSPETTPAKKYSPNKIENIKYKLEYLWQLLTQGQTIGLDDCDFSAPNGYDLIVAHQ